MHKGFWSQGISIQQLDKIELKKFIQSRWDLQTRLRELGTQLLLTVPFKTRLDKVLENVLYREQTLTGKVTGDLKGLFHLYLL